MDPVYRKSFIHTHTQTFALHKLSAIWLCGSYSTRSDQYLPHCPHTATVLKGTEERERERGDTNIMKERRRERSEKE